MRKKPSIEKYARKALKLGAVDAKKVPAKSIVTAPWVRIKCQYGCGGYGQCLTCPPYSPKPDETAAMLKNFQSAVMIHGNDHTDVTRIASTLEREAFLDGYYKAFAMGSGPCRLCSDCDLENEECRKPDEARPSMEACGIDVFQTVRNNGFPIEVLKTQNCKQNYYSVILIE